MLDHVSVNVRDLAASRRFYEKSLEPLGYGVIMEFDAEMAGFGREGKPSFWIVRREPLGGQTHVAFQARERAAVSAFHAAALAAGGTDNGPPGLRPDYHEQYFAAFTLDPDGNNIEAVCHRPE